MADKPTPYRAFGKLLAAGIKQLALARRASLKSTHDQLAEELGYSSNMIYAWRRGEHLPKPEVVEALSRRFVKGWQADQQWINGFLEKSEYGPPSAAARIQNELFGHQMLPGEPSAPHDGPTQAPEPEPAGSSASGPVSIRPWQYKAGPTVAAAVLSAKGELAVAGTLGKKVYCFDRMGDLSWEFKVGNQAWRAGISDDASTIGIGTGSTRPWDLSGRGLYCFDRAGSLQWQVDLQASVWGLTVSADGETMAVGTSGKQLILFDGRGNRLWHQDISGIGPYAWVWSTGLSADGQTVAAGAADKRLRLFQRTGVILAEHQARGDVFTVAVSADGQHIAAGDGAGYIYWLDREGHLLWEEQLNDKVWAVVLSADGTRLLVGAGEKEAHIRSYNQAGQLLWRRFAGGGISSLALSADGQRVAAGTRNGGIYILGEEGAVLHQAKANKQVRGVSISATGDRVVAGSEDGMIYGFELSPLSPVNAATSMID